MFEDGVLTTEEFSDNVVLFRNTLNKVLSASTALLLKPIQRTYYLAGLRMLNLMKSRIHLVCENDKHLQGKYRA